MSLILITIFIAMLELSKNKKLPISLLVETGVVLVLQSLHTNNRCCSFRLVQGWHPDARRKFGTFAVLPPSVMFLMLVGMLCVRKEDRVSF